MAIVYTYNTDGYYNSTMDDYGFTMPNSTPIKPDFIDGYIPKWNGESWDQVENHVGKHGYVNGVPTIITEYGPLPDGWSDTPPPPPLETVRAQMKWNMKTTCDEAFMRATGLKDPTPMLCAAEFTLLTLTNQQKFRDIYNTVSTRYYEIIDQIDAATTHDELNAIDLTM